MGNNNNKTESDKEKTLRKWSSIIEGLDNTTEDKSWIDEYTQVHSITGSELTIENTNLESTSLLPMASKVAAKTIGLDIVPVSPMGGCIPEEELEKIKNRLKVENRQGKIDSVINNEEFIEKELEGDKEYKELNEKYPGTISSLLYMDYKYGGDEEE